MTSDSVTFLEFLEAVDAIEKASSSGPWFLPMADWALVVLYCTTSEVVFDWENSWWERLRMRVLYGWRQDAIDELKEQLWEMKPIFDIAMAREKMKARDHA